MENDNQNAGPDALPAGQYETGTIDFNPAAQRPYSGCTLELRYGPVDIPIMEPHLRACALVNGRRVATTTALQIDLFGDEHVPGTSRHPDPTSAGFSFLLATSVILAAGVLKIPDVTGRLARASAARYWLARSLCSGIGAFLAVRFLVRYFQTRTLTPFAGSTGQSRARQPRLPHAEMITGTAASSSRRTRYPHSPCTLMLLWPQASPTRS